MPYRLYAVSSEGDIQVVAKPAAERDMPTAPELRDACGDIRIVKVFGKTESENAAEPYRHIRIPGKVEIDVQHICCGVQPIKQHGFLAVRLEFRHDKRCGICKENLLCKTDGKARNPLRRVGKRGFPVFQTPGDVGIADDGPGYQLRKHRHIHGKIDIIPLCRHVAAIHIYDIAQDLERIKADTYRQSHLQKRDGKTGHRIEVSDKKVRIFAICKQTETGDRRNGKRQLGDRLPAKALNQKRGNIRLRDRRKHKNEIFRLSPTVEQETCQKKHEILHTVGNNEIHEQNARQEAVQERYT